MGKGNSYQDAPLIAALRRGGRAREQAMAELYRAEVEAMVSFIQRQGGDEETARDIFQDAVIQLLTAIESEVFAGQSSLRTYLFAIGKRMWYNRLRRQQTERRYQESLTPEELRVIEQTPEGSLMDQHQRELISGVLDQLGQTCREVLTLWSMKYAMKEIAERVGYANEQTARNKKSKCLRSLQELVRERPAVRDLVKELSSGR